MSVDAPETSRGLAKRLGGLGFPLLSDPDLAVATAYGVAMEGMDIAVPSIFLIAPGGTIVWRDIGERVDDRPTMQWLLWQLDEARRSRR